MSVLTPQRENFARRYALTGNGRESAVSAGYSQRSADSTASRLIRIDKVASAIITERDRLRVKVDLRAEDVIAGLRSIAEDESAPHAARVSAWKALGNHLGLFQWNPVAEATATFLAFLADGTKPAVEAQVRHIELQGSSSG